MTYEDDLRKGLVTISNTGVMHRDISGTLKDRKMTNPSNAGMPEEIKECFYCTGTGERYGAKLHHGIQCINCGLQLSMTGTCARNEVLHVWNKIPRADLVEKMEEVSDGKL
jgi:hypothetical protein